MPYMPLEKLLSEYFQKPELQHACANIDEPTSYNNPELITIILNEWENKGRNKYELFEYLDRPTLSRICRAYKIEHRGNWEVLLKRIKKKKLLDNSHTKIKIGGGGVVLVIILFLLSPFYNDFIEQFNEPEIEQIESKNLSEEIESKMKPNPLIPFLDVWKTFNENRPYSLQWTRCAFGSHTSPEGEKSWSFSMTPILINKNGEPALIPFNISYRFNYEKIVDGKPLSLFGATSEGSQKHLVDVPDRKPISFHNFSDALNAALAEDTTVLKIMKTKSSFNPYSEEIDDNLLSEFESDKNDYLVAHFVFDENNESWSMLQPKEAICSNIYDT